jgi:hypothetical protein
MIREVEKPEVGISYRKEKTADFVGCAQGHFLLWSEDVGKREFSGKVRAATNVAATRLAATDFITYNFTEITITTPPLTRIL